MEVIIYAKCDFCNFDCKLHKNGGCHRETDVIFEINHLELAGNHPTSTQSLPSNYDRFKGLN